MDYKNGKIYAIRSHQTDQIYIGSTCSPLSKRLYQHKANYKGYLNKKYHYASSHEITQYDDAYIELLEECPCENKIQLYKKEGELIRENNCVNKHIAGRTIKENKREYYEQNKDKIKEYYEQNRDKIKEYYEQNKDKIKEYNREYREQNRDNIKENKREYYEQNRDKIKENNREYREQNRDNIKENK